MRQQTSETCKSPHSSHIGTRQHTEGDTKQLQMLCVVVLFCLFAVVLPRFFVVFASLCSNFVSLWGCFCCYFAIGSGNVSSLCDCFVSCFSHYVHFTVTFCSWSPGGNYMTLAKFLFLYNEVRGYSVSWVGFDDWVKYISAAWWLLDNTSASFIHIYTVSRSIFSPLPPRESIQGGTNANKVRLTQLHGHWGEMKWRGIYSSGSNSAG